MSFPYRREQRGGGCGGRTSMSRGDAAAAQQVRPPARHTTLTTCIPAQDQVESSVSGRDAQGAAAFTSE